MIIMIIDNCWSEDFLHKSSMQARLCEGMFVEMTGRASWEPPETGLELLTRAQLPPHLRHAPTRAEAGPGLWARVTAHPGLATRSRYGPGYLHHVQSWRHVPGM